MKALLRLTGTGAFLVLEAVCDLVIFWAPIALLGLYVLATEVLGFTWIVAFIACVVVWATISIAMIYREGNW